MSSVLKVALRRPPLPSWRHVTALADWVELTGIAGGHPVTVGELEQALERAGAKRARMKAESAWRVLHWREQLLAGNWPFQLQSPAGLNTVDRDLVATPGHRNTLFYAFLAALSLGEEIDNAGRKLFEYCVADVVRVLSDNFAIVVGAPRPGRPANGHGMPADLNEAIDLYAKLSKDQRRGPFAADDNDFGLDIVTWRRFRDGRGGYLHFLGQCATGHDWYAEKKAGDLSIAEWNEHVGWAVRPVRFFAIPFFAPSEDIKFRRSSRRGGLVLDRARLIEFAEKSPLARRHAWRIREYLRKLYDDGPPSITLRPLASPAIDRLAHARKQGATTPDELRREAALADANRKAS